MKVIDEYGVDGGDKLCTTRWARILTTTIPTAGIHGGGLLRRRHGGRGNRADSQNAALPGDGFFDVYDRLDFAAT
jgi:hypothetical protein